MVKTRMSKKFDKCVKSVRKTVKARKGSNKESAAIAICTTTLLHRRGRTLKSYRKGKLMTQKLKKTRRGGQVEEPKPSFLGRLKTSAASAATALKDKATGTIKKIKSQFEPETEDDKDYGFTLTDEEQARREAMGVGKA